MTIKGNLGVIGSGDEIDVLNELAVEVGSLIAEAGYALINGGLGGVMAASSRGAKEAGGLTIGLLPGAKREDANEHVEIVMPTGMGDMRNALIVRASVGLIAIGGGAGTLSEIALAIKAKRPVVSLKSFNQAIGSIDISDKIVEAKDPKDAVEKLLALITDNA